MPAIYPTPATSSPWWWAFGSAGAVPVTPAPPKVVPEPVGYTLVIYFAGERLEWPGVRVPIESSLTVWGQSSVTRSMSLNATPWPVDVGALYLEGHPFSGSPAVLYAPDGTIALYGTLRGGRWGRGVGSMVSCTIDETGDDTELFPPMSEVTLRVRDDEASQALIDAAANALTVDVPFPSLSIDTSSPAGKILQAWASNLTRPIHPTIDPAAWPADVLNIYTDQRIGRVYPFVFGEPGRSYTIDTASSTSTDPYPATPAIPLRNQVVGQEAVLVAGHKVDATQLTLYGPNGRGGLYSQVLPITTEQDAAGRTVSTVSLQTANRYLPDPAADQPPLVDGFDLDGFGGDWIDEDWYCAWTHGEAFSGRLGDVVALMLGTMGRRIDWTRAEELRPRLNTYQVDGYIDEQVKPREWLESALQPFPSSIVDGNGGTYVWVWDAQELPRWTIADEPGKCSIDDDEAEELQEPPYNHLRLQHTINDASDRHIRTTRVRTMRADESIGREGLSEKEIKTDIIAREAVAERVASEWLEFHSRRPIRLRCWLNYADYRDIAAGDTCSVNVSGLAVGTGVVEAVSWDGADELRASVLWLPGWRQ